jgi:hypothetical protein
VHQRPVYHPGLRRRLGNAVNVTSALTGSGLLNPSRPVRFTRQFAVLRAWGTTLAGEFTSAAARDPYRRALIDYCGALTYRELGERTTVPRDVYFIARPPRNATGKVVGRWLAQASPAPAGHPAGAGTDAGMDAGLPEGQVAF